MLKIINSINNDHLDGKLKAVDWADEGSPTTIAGKPVILG
jgi:hypothetical protein